LLFFGSDGYVGRIELVDGNLAFFQCFFVADFLELEQVTEFLVQVAAGRADLFAQFFDFLVELFQVFGTADSFSFEKPHGTPRDGKLTFGVFARFGEKHTFRIRREILVISLHQVDIVQDKVDQTTVLDIKLDDLRGGNGIGEKLALAGLEALKMLQHKEIGLASRCITEQLDRCNRLHLGVHHVVVHVAFEVVFDGHPILFIRSEQVGEEGNILAPRVVFLEEFDGFREAFEVFDQ